MRKILLPLSLVFLILIVSGCSTKREYFEPLNPAGKIRYDGSLPDKIIDASRNGATLQNGQVITSTGLQSVQLPEGFLFVNSENDRYIGVNACGGLIIVDANGTRLYEKKFDSTVASANIKDNILALVFADNSLAIVDILSTKELFSLRGDMVYAHDSKIALPYFLKGLVVFPTLDGKIIIVDTNTHQVVRDIVVKSEKFFSNIIYLDVLDDRLVAATKNRVISINPTSMAYLDEEIKDVIILKDRVLIFTKDGKILLTNADLKVLKERKFKFAVFAGMIYGEFIYVVERGGYLIATDLDLVSVNIYELPDAIDTFLFTTKDQFFYGDKYFKLAKK
ncbi:MAG: hypothetical protein IBX44_06005 [Sulfurospirillum sp.]|nr:hypothetical protein [Sulfurospirillum sp.]